MTTALDLITRSLKLANILGEGQTPSSEQATGALDTFNEMLQGWNLDSLALWATSNEDVTLIPGQSVYTIGSGGDFAVDRPVQINSLYQTYQGVTFRIDLINQDEYNLITLKTLSQPIVRYCLYVNDYPLGKMTLWPVPSVANTLTLSVDRLIATVPSVATTITAPPGYMRAFRANLAVELCPEYGREPSPALLQAARDSFADIKRGNWQPTVSEFDPALIGAPTGLAGFLQGY